MDTTAPKPTTAELVAESHQAIEALEVSIAANLQHLHALLNLQEAAGAGPAAAFWKTEVNRVDALHLELEEAHEDHFARLARLEGEG